MTPSIFIYDPSHIQQWLNSDMKETPHEMARILSTITFNGPLFAAGLKK